MAQVKVVRATVRALQASGEMGLPTVEAVRYPVVDKVVELATGLSAVEKSAVIAALHGQLAIEGQATPSAVVIQSTAVVAGMAKSGVVVLSSMAPSLVQKTALDLAEFASLELWEQLAAKFSEWEREPAVEG